MFNSINTFDKHHPGFPSRVSHVDHSYRLLVLRHGTATSFVPKSADCESCVALRVYLFVAHHIATRLDSLVCICLMRPTPMSVVPAARCRTVRIENLINLSMFSTHLCDVVHDISHC